MTCRMAAQIDERCYRINMLIFVLTAANALLSSLVVI